MPRALALPPAERRVQLVHVARELIGARGQVPSTRDIAEAAGVAEGTIFRVFDTKDELLDAVVHASFCPAIFRRGLDDIDLGLPLRARLVVLVTLLQQRFTEVFGLMGAMGLSAPPPSMWQHHDRCTPESGHVEPADAKPFPVETFGSNHVAYTSHQSDEARTAYLAEKVIVPDADLLRCTPTQLVTYLRLLTFSGSHPHISGGRTLTPDEIVDVVLTGVEIDSATIEYRKMAPCSSVS